MDRWVALKVSVDTIFARESKMRAELVALMRLCLKFEGSIRPLAEGVSIRPVSDADDSELEGNTIQGGCYAFIGYHEPRQHAVEVERPSAGAFFVWIGAPDRSQCRVGAEGGEYPSGSSRMTGRRVDRSSDNWRIG